MPELLVSPVLFTGGLEDSKTIEEPGDFRLLDNATVFRGRIAPRAPFIKKSTLSVDKILAVTLHANGMYVVTYKGGATPVVELYGLDLNGDNPSLKGTVWSGVSSVPRVVLASMGGGSSSTAINRLYIADYAGNLPTRYFVEPSTFTTVQEDLNDDGVKEDVKFTYVFPFMYHLFGASFFSGTLLRSEVLRFSRPGLIAEDSGSGLATEPREWWPEDYRPIGARGVPITCLSSAGLAMIVFKARETYAFYGFDAQSWQVRQISRELGAVGPYAAASVGDLCFFWSERGPAVTDGATVTDLSEPVRKRVLDSVDTDTHIVAFSPDDLLVYFFYPVGTDTYPTRYLAYHIGTKRFVGEGSLWAPARHAAMIPAVQLPGPAAAPSGLTATAKDHASVELSWTNGDSSMETFTEIERDAGAGFVLVATLVGGVAKYTDSNLNYTTTYTYRIRHKRNNQYSAYSATAQARTFLPPPANFSASSVSNGVKLTFTNNVSGADIVIERRQYGVTGWNVLTTLTNQLPGSITYTDTTASLLVSYQYRAKTKKLNETDSLYTEVKESISGFAPTVFDVYHNLLYSTTGSTFIHVGWKVSGSIPPGSKVEVYRAFGTGAPFNLVATLVTVSQGANSHTDEILNYVINPSSPATDVQYRIDLIQDGVLLSTATSPIASYNLQQVPE